MVDSSEKMKAVHSEIRGPLYREALRMEASGIPVLKLNTGNPGRFGFRMPDSVRSALTQRMEEAVPYCDVRGMPEAREAVCAYHSARGIRGIRPEDVFLCNGVSEAAPMALQALLSPGDEVLLPAPDYSLWSNSVILAGGRPVYYRCDPRNGWDPDPEDIRSRLSPATRAILVIDPNNPTGAVYSRAVKEEIVRLARENHLVLIADEIYDRLLLDGAEHITLASLAPDIPCITLNGLSKSHVICGFRCGWMVFSGPWKEYGPVPENVLKLASMRLCGNALTQLVIPAALRDFRSTRLMCEGRLREQRDAVCSALEGIEGLTFVPNRAAFYLFPGVERDRFDFEDAEELCSRFLQECHVLLIPGNGFDWREDLRFRIVMLPEPDVLREAMRQLGDFLDRHRR